MQRLAEWSRPALSGKVTPLRLTMGPPDNVNLAEESVDLGDDSSPEANRIDEPQ